VGFISFTFIDIVDIVVVALIMYYIYKIARGTPAPSILTGILLIYILWMVVDALQMQMLRAIMGHIIGVGVIALIVVFQPEIRRFLQMIGKRSMRRKTFWGRLFSLRGAEEESYEYLTPLVRACTEMSTARTGALIVIQREVVLTHIAESGVAVDAVVSTPLLKNIFFKNSPLHDGAVIIKDGRIEAAKCVLPSTQSEVPVSFGMRHRAALGASEATDAVVVVVSEETGGIAIAHNGEIRRKIAHEKLHREILKELKGE
jgi:uncharacterized protein (TIGR00159 family)